MAEPSFVPWVKRAQDQDYIAADPATKLKLFEDWRKDTETEFNRTGAWTPETLYQFQLHNEKTRRELRGETVDPDMLVQEFITGQEERNRHFQTVQEAHSKIASTQQGLDLEKRQGWYDAAETFVSNFGPAILSGGVLPAGQRKQKPKEDPAKKAARQEEQKKLIETTRAQFNPEELVQAKVVEDTLMGKTQWGTLAGSLVVNPMLYFADKEKFLEVVNGADADPLAKAEAIAGYNDVKERVAEGIWEPLNLIPEFREWNEKNPDATKTEAVEWWQREKGQRSNNLPLSFVTMGLSNLISKEQEAQVGLGLTRSIWRLYQQGALLYDIGTGKPLSEGAGMEAEMRINGTGEPGQYALNDLDQAMNQLGAGTWLGLGLDDLAEGTMSLVPTMAASFATRGVTSAGAGAIRVLADRAGKRALAQGLAKKLPAKVIQENIDKTLFQRLNRMLARSDMEKMAQNIFAAKLNPVLDREIQRAAVSSAAGLQSAGATMYHAYVQHRKILASRGFEGEELERMAREEAVKDGVRTGVVTFFITGFMGLRGAEALPRLGEIAVNPAARKAFTESFKSFLKEAVTEEAFAAGQKAASRAAVRETVKQVGKVTLVEGALEALEEGADEFINYAFDALRNNPNPSLEQWIMHTAGAAAMGGIIGAGVGGGVNLSNEAKGALDYQAWIDSDPDLQKAKATVASLKEAGATEAAAALEEKVAQAENKEGTRLAVAETLGTDGQPEETLASYDGDAVELDGEVGVLTVDRDTGEATFTRTIDDAKIPMGPASTALSKTKLSPVRVDTSVLDTAAGEASPFMVSGDEVRVKTPDGTFQEATAIRPNDDGSYTVETPAGPVTLDQEAGAKLRERLTQKQKAPPQPWIKTAKIPGKTDNILGAKAKVTLGENPVEGEAQIIGLRTNGDAVEVVIHTEGDPNSPTFTLQGHQVEVNGRPVSDTALERGIRRERADGNTARAEALALYVEEARKDPNGGLEYLLTPTPDLLKGKGEPVPGGPEGIQTTKFGIKSREWIETRIKAKQKVLARGVLSDVAEASTKEEIAQLEKDLKAAADQAVAEEEAEAKPAETKAEPKAEAGSSWEGVQTGDPSDLWRGSLSEGDWKFTGKMERNSEGAILREVTTPDGRTSWVYHASLSPEQFARLSGTPKVEAEPQTEGVVPAALLQETQAKYPDSPGVQRAFQIIGVPEDGATVSQESYVALGKELMVSLNTAEDQGNTQDVAQIEASLTDLGYQPIGEVGQEVAFLGLRHISEDAVWPGDPVRITRRGWQVNEEGGFSTLLRKAQVEAVVAPVEEAPAPAPADPLSEASLRDLYALDKPAGGRKSVRLKDTWDRLKSQNPEVTLEQFHNRLRELAVEGKVALTHHHLPVSLSEDELAVTFKAQDGSTIYAYSFFPVEEATTPAAPPAPATPYEAALEAIAAVVGSPNATEEGLLQPIEEREGEEKLNYTRNLAENVVYAYADATTTEEKEAIRDFFLRIPGAKMVGDVGDSAKFYGLYHRGDGTLSEGDPVEITEPGFLLSNPPRGDYLISKAVVRALPLEKLMPRRESASDAYGRILQSAKGRSAYEVKTDLDAQVFVADRSELAQAAQDHLGQTVPETTSRLAILRQLREHALAVAEGRVEPRAQPSLEKRFLDAYLKITNGKYGERVKFRELKAELPDVSIEEIWKLSKSLWNSPIDNPREITPEDLQYRWSRPGGQVTDLIRIRREDVGNRLSVPEMAPEPTPSVDPLEELSSEATMAELNRAIAELERQGRMTEDTMSDEEILQAVETAWSDLFAENRNSEVSFDDLLDHDSRLTMEDLQAYVEEGVEAGTVEPVQSDDEDYTNTFSLDGERISGFTIREFQTQQGMGDAFVYESLAAYQQAVVLDLDRVFDFGQENAHEAYVREVVERVKKQHPGVSFHVLNTIPSAAITTPPYTHNGQRRVRVFYNERQLIALTRGLDSAATLEEIDRILLHEAIHVSAIREIPSAELAALGFALQGELRGEGEASAQLYLSSPGKPAPTPAQVAAYIQNHPYSLAQEYLRQQTELALNGETEEQASAFWQSQPRLWAHIRRYFRRWMAKAKAKARLRKDPRLAAQVAKILATLWKMNNNPAGVDVGEDAGFVAEPLGSLSSGRVTPEQDADYMAAVEAGDMAKAQAMVDAAAKAAGYNMGPVYHWTDSEFDAFEIAHEGAHFGTEQAAWDRARGMAQIGYEIEEDAGEYWVYADAGPNEGDGQGPFQSQAAAKAFIKTQPKRISPLRMHLSLRNAIKLPDLGVWGAWDIIRHLPKNLLSDKTREQIMSADDRYGALRQALLKKGIDGFYYTNEVEDAGSISYIVLNPNQIKSADPVTRDSAGKVIPLSQRFNPESDSILFSRSASRKEVLIQDLARSGPTVDAILSGAQSDGSVRYEDRNGTLWKVQGHPYQDHYASLDVRDSTVTKVGGKEVRLTLLEKVQREDGTHDYTFLIHPKASYSLKGALRDAAVLSIARQEGAVGGRASSTPRLSMEQAEGFVADYLGETRPEAQTQLSPDQEHQAFESAQELLSFYNDVDLFKADTVYALDQQGPEGLLASRTHADVAAEDAAYEAALREGNGEKAQQLVDAAAKRAGYTQVVFHGGKSGIEVFNVPSWFSDNVEYSREFAFGEYSENPKTNQLYKLYMRLENPLDWRDHTGSIEGQQFLQWLAEAGVKPNQAAALAVYSQKGPMFRLVRHVLKNDPTMFKRAGYDGLIIPDSMYRVKGGDVQAVSFLPFNPSQVKSAETITRSSIPLSQRFNPASDSILYSRTSAPVDNTPQPSKVNTYKTNEIPAQYRQEAGSRDEGGHIETATKLTRRVHKTVEGLSIPNPPRVGDARREFNASVREHESKLLVKWATDKGLMRPYQEFMDRWESRPVADRLRGEEHLVHMEPENGRMMARKLYTASESRFFGTYYDYFTQLTLHNALFSAVPYRIDGMTVSPEGVVMALVSQPAVPILKDARGRRVKATAAEVKAWMEAQGFVQMSETGYYTILEDGTRIEVTDLHDDNIWVVGEGAPGKRPLAVIDADIKIAPARVKAEPLAALAPGRRIQSPAIQADRALGPSVPEVMLVSQQGRLLFGNETGGFTRQGWMPERDVVRKLGKLGVSTGTWEAFKLANPSVVRKGRVYETDLRAAVETGSPVLETEVQMGLGKGAISPRLGEIEHRMDATPNLWEAHARGVGLGFMDDFQNSEPYARYPQSAAEIVELAGQYGLTAEETDIVTRFTDDEWELLYEHHEAAFDEAESEVEDENTSSPDMVAQYGTIAPDQPQPYDPNTGLGNVAFVVRAKGVEGGGQHTGADDALGWVRGKVVLVDGQRVGRIDEVQSDAAQAWWKKHKKINSAYEFLDSSVDAGPYFQLKFQAPKHEKTMLEFPGSPKALEEAKALANYYHNDEKHPLFDSYNEILLRTAIQEFQKLGVTQVFLPDSKTAMLTEGHDRMSEEVADAPELIGRPVVAWGDFLGVIRDLRPDGSLVVEGPNEELTYPDWQDTDAPEDLVKRALKRPRKVKNPFQEGMETNYDRVLPNTMRKLTGAPGRAADLGDHKNAPIDNARALQILTDEFQEDAQRFGFRVGTKGSDVPTLLDRKGERVSRLRPDETPETREFIDRFNARRTRLFEGRDNGILTPRLFDAPGQPRTNVKGWIFPTTRAEAARRQPDVLPPALFSRAAASLNQALFGPVRWAVVANPQDQPATTWYGEDTYARARTGDRQAQAVERQFLDRVSGMLDQGLDTQENFQRWWEARVVRPGERLLSEQGQEATVPAPTVRSRAFEQAPVVEPTDVPTDDVYANLAQEAKAAVARGERSHPAVSALAGDLQLRKIASGAYYKSVGPRMREEFVDEFFSPGQERATTYTLGASGQRYIHKVGKGDTLRWRVRVPVGDGKRRGTDFWWNEHGGQQGALDAAITWRDQNLDPSKGKATRTIGGDFYVALQKWDGQGDFASFLYGFARNRAREFAERNFQGEVSIEALEDTGGVERFVDTTAQVSPEVAATVAEALALVSPRTREILLAEHRFTDAGVVDYTPEELQAAHAEVARVLRPGPLASLAANNTIRNEGGIFRYFRNRMQEGQPVLREDVLEDIARTTSTYYEENGPVGKREENHWMQDPTAQRLDLQDTFASTFKRVVDSDPSAPPYDPVVFNDRSDRLTRNEQKRRAQFLRSLDVIFKQAGVTEEEKFPYLWRLVEAATSIESAELSLIEQAAEAWVNGGLYGTRGPNMLPSAPQEEPLASRTSAPDLTNLAIRAKLAMEEDNMADPVWRELMENPILHGQLKVAFDKARRSIFGAITWHPGMEEASFEEFQNEFYGPGTPVKEGRTRIRGGEFQRVVLAKYNPERGALQTFVSRVARLAAENYMRRKLAGSMDTRPLEDVLFAAEPSPEMGLRKAEQQALVAAAMAKLPVAQQDVLAAKYGLRESPRDPALLTPEEVEESLGALRQELARLNNQQGMRKTPTAQKPEDLLDPEVLASRPGGGQRKRRLVNVYGKPKAGKYTPGGWTTASGMWDQRIFKDVEGIRGKEAANKDRVEELYGKLKRALRAEYGRDESLYPRKTMTEALGNQENKLTAGQLRTADRLHKQGLTAARTAYMQGVNAAAALDRSANLGSTVTIRGRSVSDPATIRAEAAYQRALAKAAFAQAVDVAKGQKDAYLQSARLANRTRARAKRAAAMASLPQPIQVILKKMRAELDNLSGQIIVSGAVSDDLQATIGENMELYLHRSYQIWDNPDTWKEIILANPQRDPNIARIRHRAERFIRQELVRAAVKKGATKAAAQASVTQDMVQERLLEYLQVADGSSGSILFGSKEGAKPVNMLKHLKNVPEPIQELWGRYDDPMVNFAKSMASMSMFLTNHEFLTKLRDLGVQEGWLTRGPLGPNGKVHVPILGKNASNPRYSPLAGWYGPIELADAFDAFASQREHHMVMDAFLKLTAIGMMTKTVYSLPSTARNFWGNVFPAIANGHLKLWSPAFWQSAKMKSLFMRIVNRGDEATRARIRRYVELGVIGDSLTENLTRELLNLTPDKLNKSALDYWWSRMWEKAKETNEFFGKLYGMQDDFWKIIAFEDELDRVKRYRKGSGMSMAEMEREAADITKDTMFSYSRAPTVVQGLRGQPFIAPFFTFTGEVIRTGFNTTRLGWVHLLQGMGLMADANGVKSKNRALALAGVDRIMGTIAASAGMAAFLKIASMMAAALKGEDWDDWGEEQDHDLRQHVPEWSKDSDLIYLGREGTEIRYYDMTYLNPYDLFYRPFRAFGQAWRDPNQDLGDAMGAWIKSALDPAAKEQIFFGTLMDVMRGVDTQGKRIYEEGEDTKKKALKILGHAWEGVFEPGTVTQIRRALKAQSGHVERTGRSYDIWEETVWAAIGMRLSRADTETSLSYGLKKFDFDVRDASSTFTRNFTSMGTVPDETLQRSFLEANQKRERAFLKARAKIVSALRLGTLTENEVIRIMASEKVSRTEMAALLGNFYPRYEPTKQTLDIAREKGAMRGQDRIGLWLEARQTLPPIKRPLSLDEYDEPSEKLVAEE